MCFSIGIAVLVLGSVCRGNRRRRVMESENQQLIGVAGSARILGVTPSRVRQLADAGTLPGNRTLSGVRIFRLQDVERLAEARVLKRQQAKDAALAAEGRRKDESC
jgi:hypothetical protein